MEYALFALPIHKDKAAAARAFLQDLEGKRKDDYAVSERRLGITKEVWAIQQTPMGQLLLRRLPPAWVPQTSATADELQLGLNSHLPKAAIVYQCPSCDARLLGHQRCEECGVFGKRLGPGGWCPHCDEVVAINDLLAELRSITIAAGR